MLRMEVESLEYTHGNVLCYGGVCAGEKERERENNSIHSYVLNEKHSVLQTEPGLLFAIM